VVTADEKDPDMFHHSPIRRTVLMGAAVLLAGLAHGASAQSRDTVKFAKGNDNASVQSKVTGEGYHDYLLGAKAGQTMSVSLVTAGSAYFNILPPGSNDVAIYNSSIDGNDATGIVLPKSGNYTIRVYLMGADADGGATVPFTLSMGIN
jgi:hypothetical protein